MKTDRPKPLWIGLQTGLAVLLACSLLLAGLAPARAQSGGHITLLPPESTHFPEMDFYLAAYDTQNNFLPDLQPTQLKVLENDQPRPLTKLERIEPGLQFILAVNPGSTMALSAAGVTYYQQVSNQLTAWARLRAGLPNDYSLSTNTGLQSIRQTDPNIFTDTITAYQVDLATVQPSLNSLTQALDLAIDPNPRPRMKRAILYITVPLPASLQAGMPNLISRASQMGVPVFVWLVAPINYATSPAAEVLAQLAANTGGQFFLYSGAEKLPEIETYLRPLRYLYHGAYASGITKGGAQRLSVQIEQPGLNLASSSVRFELNIQPPNPIFLSPPVSITLKAVQGSLAANPSYEPRDTPIQILIEYPDGHQRPLRRTRLFVDGTLAAENTVVPFETFLWKLDAYTDTKQHLLKVEVEDTLGLRRSSIETPVQVVVQKPIMNRVAKLLANRALVLGGSLGLAGVLILVLMIIIGPRIWRAIANRPKSELKDPVTQPVRAHIEPASQTRRSAGRASASWPRPSQPGQGAPAAARLVRLSETGQPLSSSAIPINSIELTLGSDPQQAICVLEAPSISPLHARLTRANDGSYTLADAGSIAGTWVNYAPVSTLGVHLEHGDLVQIGRVAFRFELSRSTAPRQPVVQPYKEDQP